jgi:hypothetical protein
MVIRRPNSAITESAGKKDIMEARYWIEAPPCEGCPHLRRLARRGLHS